jgi:cation:H+ antiporter
MIWLNIILLAAGFFCLLKGADYLVDGASSFAKKSGMSSLAIGLTIVAFGTSMPEFTINIMSWAAGTNSLSVGNIIGSNLVNLLLVLGITAYFFELDLVKPVKKEAIFTLLSAILVLILINNQIGKTTLNLNMLDGLILLMFFGVFLFTTFTKKKENFEIPIQRYNTKTTLMFISLGIIGLALGGWIIVDNASEIARSFGISEVLIGLTIIAIGTTLPEMATSITAAIKKAPGISIGNILGSCIFNTLFIFGFGALLRPIDFFPAQNIDMLFFVFASIIVLVMVIDKKRHSIKKKQGIILILIYIIMVTFFILREMLV